MKSAAMPSLQKETAAAFKNSFNEGIIKEARMCDKPTNYAKKSFKRKIPTPRSSNFETAVSKLEKIAELTNSEEDQYTQFGNHVASQLRELPIRSFILLQEKIQRLITQERLNFIEVAHQLGSSYDVKPVPSTTTAMFSLNCSHSSTESTPCAIDPFPRSYQASPNLFVPPPCSSTDQDRVYSVVTVEKKVAALTTASEGYLQPTAFYQM